MKYVSIVLLPLLLLGAGCLDRDRSNANNDGGVFKSVNGGQEWAQAIIVPTAAGIGTLATTDILNMEMDPQDREYIYLGTRQNGMLYSEDGGASWRQPTDEALQSGLIFNIAVDPTDVCTVYIAKGARLYRTTDCMRSFNSETYVDNRSGVSVVQVAVDWYNPRVIWIGLSNGDVQKSDDAGRNWRTVLKADDEISGFLINNTDSRFVLVSTFTDGMFKTTDNGATWQEVDGGLGELKQADRVYQLVQSRDASVVIAATQYGLVRSSDFGTTWEPISLVTSPAEVSIRAVGIDPQHPSTIYYAANSTFYRSTDAGATWDTERFQTSRVARAMLVDPEDAQVLYIGVATATE